MINKKFFFLSLIFLPLMIMSEPKNSLSTPSKPVVMPKASTKKETKIVEEKKTQKAKKSEKLSTEQLMCAMYAGISGFGIPTAEEAKITECGGAPTYGEILYESLKTLLDEMPSSNIKNGVLYDLGSGVGKVCVQAYLDYPFAKVVGIELSKKRYDASIDILQTLQEQGYIDKNRTLQFLNEDFMKSNISDATVIYMCSTCYSPELMGKLGEKFSKLKPGLQVITLKSMPDYEKYGLELIGEYKLPMTWSKESGGSPVYVYKLGGKKKVEKQIKKETKKTTKKKKK